jgi:hypothetical protein
MDEIRFNHYLPYFENGCYDIVVNVQLPPASIERITVTIMSDDTNTYQSWEIQEEMQPPASDYGSQDTGTTQKVLPAWERIAERDASDDIDEIKDLQDNGHFVIFDDKLFDRRIKSLARRKTDRFLEDTTVTLGHEALREAYERAYLRIFEKKKYLVQENLTEIKDEHEKQLRDTLILYRPLVQDRSQRNWHARDLVLVCILQIYHRDYLNNLDIIDALSERHALIDKYENFVCDPEGRNEVTWPDPSFRP